MPSPKKEIEWAWVERHWQEGVLSNHAIASLHGKTFGVSLTEGTIRNRIKNFGWTRDIAESVRRETRRKLASGATPEDVKNATQSFTQDGDDNITHVTRRVMLEESEAVDVESDRAVEVVNLHRFHAKKLHSLASQIEAYAIAALPVDDQGLPKFTYEPGDLKDLSGVVANVAATRGKAVDIERKAYSLDESEQGKLGAVSAIELLRGYLNGDEPLP